MIDNGWLIVDHIVMMMTYLRRYYGLLLLNWVFQYLYTHLSSICVNISDDFR